MYGYRPVAREILPAAVAVGCRAVPNQEEPREAAPDVHRALLGRIASEMPNDDVLCWSSR